MSTRQIDPRVEHFANMLKTVGIARVIANLPPGWAYEHREGLYTFRLRDDYMRRPVGGVLCIERHATDASRVAAFVAGVLPNIITLDPGEYQP